ncbi:hypothetical protein Y919_10275 [Caloranaerobacter azorensis H53214]|uniref:Uncharacterized protein n=1 Tax=Caloranaerobacter azorensis H53214 TaxID=1156417 RepID=A0A096BG75_9FIRM|nr:hypothetical protein [Caloranaerobacter azorensis]KGG79733.1 hypothetical protein Y919_10275 [Caloranaerobacter azorensis H53214]
MSPEELYNHLISEGINVVSYSNQGKGEVELYEYKVEDSFHFELILKPKEFINLLNPKEFNTFNFSLMEDAP